MLYSRLATHKWLTARPVRLAVLNGTAAAAELPDDVAAGKFRGTISLGLFQGTKVLNYGFGDRTSTVWSEYARRGRPLNSFASGGPCV